MPCDAPLGHSHDDFHGAHDFFAVNDRRARKQVSLIFSTFVIEG